MRINNHDNRIDGKLKQNKLSNVNAKNIQKGDLFKGEIIDIKQGKILIQLANSQNLMARLTEEIEFTIGQRVLFQAKDVNKEQIFLKPILEEQLDYKNSKLFQALDEAGVPVNKENIEVIEKLMDNQLPIDKHSIHTLLQYKRQFNDTFIDNIILLLKSNINITKESLQQLERYIEGNNSIKGEIINLLNTIKNEVDITLKENTIKMIGTNEILVINSTNQNELKLVDVLSNNQLMTLKEQLTSEGNDSSITSESLGELTFSEFKSTLSSTSLRSSLRNNLLNLVANNTIDKLFNDNMLLDINAIIDNELVNNYYKNLYQNMEQLLQLSKINTTTREEMQGKVESVKHNIEFINELNNNFNYIQLPIKLNDQLLGNELYILQNKKELRNKGNNQTITALLRLDFVNLGHMDIYIAKTRNNIDCKFYVENKEKKEILYKHINTLYNKIKSINLNITGIIVMEKNHKEFDFAKDFLELNEKEEEIKRFSFDMRV